MATTTELGEQLATPIRRLAGRLPVVDVDVEVTDDRDGRESINLIVTLPDPPAGADTWPSEDILAIRRAVRQSIAEMSLEVPTLHVVSAEIGSSATRELSRMAQRAIRPDWLLRQADLLGYRGAGQGQPRNANLRRAVSAAYYAVFHAVVHEATHQLLPGGTADERHRLGRFLTHANLRAASECLLIPNKAPI